MVKPAGDGVELLLASIVLLVLTWLTFVLRMSVRVWRKSFGWDDILMFLGLVRVQLGIGIAYPLPKTQNHSPNALFRQLLFTVTASLCIVCCYLGSGQLAAVIPPPEIMRGTKVRPFSLIRLRVEQSWNLTLTKKELLHRRVLLLLRHRLHQVQHRSHSPPDCRIPPSLQVDYLDRHHRHGHFLHRIHRRHFQYLPSHNNAMG